MSPTKNIDFMSCAFAFFILIMAMGGYLKDGFIGGFASGVVAVAIVFVVILVMSQGKK
jgi:hypothetical protein